MTAPIIIGSAVGDYTATMPTHQVGDLLIVFAFWDESITPSFSAGGFSRPVSAPEWNTIESSINDGTTGISSIIGFTSAINNSMVVGNWYNTTHLIVVVVRGAGSSENTFGNLSFNTNNQSYITYPPLNLTDTSGNSTIIRFGGHLSSDVNITNTPTDFSLITSRSDSDAEIAGFSLVGPTGDIPEYQASVGGTVGFNTGYTLEIKNNSISGSLSSTLNGVNTSSVGTLGYVGNVSRVLENITSLSVSKIQVKSNSSNNLSTITLSSQSKVQIKSNSFSSISQVTLSSGSKNFIKGLYSSTVADISILSDSLIITPKVSNVSSTLNSISLSSSSSLRLRGFNNSEIGSVSILSNSKLSIKSAAPNLIDAIISAGTGYRNPYVYSDTSGNNPNFQTSGGSSDWPYGFSTFTPSDDPYRS